MQGTLIRKKRLAVCLMMVFLTVTGAFFSSCATNEPKQTALVNDPDGQPESSIPWNKPAKWESSVNVPGGIGGPAGGSISN